MTDSTAIDPRFRFVRCGLRCRSGEAHAGVRLRRRPRAGRDRSRFPGAPFVLDASASRAVARALRLLHLIAGVSYYKAAVPARSRIESAMPSTADTAALLTEHLRERPGRVRLPQRPEPARADPFPVRRRPTASKQPRRALGLGRARPGRHRWRQGFAGLHRGAARGRHRANRHLDRQLAVDRGLRRAHRPADCSTSAAQLAPELFDMNRQGAWNGHIPVTAVNSAILVLAAAAAWAPTRWCSPTSARPATAA